MIRRIVVTLLGFGLVQTSFQGLRKYWASINITTTMITIRNTKKKLCLMRALLEQSKKKTTYTYVKNVLKSR